MATAIIFYSLSGTTAAFAKEMAEKEGAELIEVREKKKRNPFTSFIIGCPQAMGQKSSKLAEPVPDLSGYEKIMIMAPVWAAFPAPAFNSIADAVPSGKDVEIFLLSGSGDSSASRPKVEEKLKSRGLNILHYEDIKSGKIPGQEPN